MWGELLQQLKKQHSRSRKICKHPHCSKMSKERKNSMKQIQGHPTQTGFLKQVRIRWTWDNFTLWDEPCLSIDLLSSRQQTDPESLEIWIWEKISKNPIFIFKSHGKIEGCGSKTTPVPPIYILNSKWLAIAQFCS